jgi:hypothetical protein
VSEQPQYRFDIIAPPELEAGVYANFLSVWHSPHEFTLDFAVTQPALETDTPGLQRVPCRVVARVKVPATVVFDMIRAMNENLTRYEGKFGVVRRPGEEQT